MGVGGGIIGDAGEFLNHSYDSLKHGLDTGDWQPMRQDVETFGAAIVLSAFVVVGTTVLAGVAGGPGAAAWVANGWAIYGIVDGLNNISELIGKVIDDVSYWVDMLSDGFMSWLKGEFGYASKVVSPLVLDLDGDGVKPLLSPMGPILTTTAMVSLKRAAGSARTMACWCGTKTAMATSATAANYSATTR